MHACRTVCAPLPAVAVERGGRERVSARVREQASDRAREREKESEIERKRARVGKSESKSESKSERERESGSNNCHAHACNVVLTHAAWPHPASPRDLYRD